MEGFSPASPLWKSHKRSAGGRILENTLNEGSVNKLTNQPNDSAKVDNTPPGGPEEQSKEDRTATLSDRRRALFEPLDSSKRTAAEVLLPPPDFDSTSYPKGWLVGKKRKLVNVDVVESMRRIAVQEMNRKDREIDGLNEQLDEDARCLEHLQLQLLQERSKRADVEREKAMLQDQVSMLMNMLEETEAMEGGEEEEEEEREEQAPTDS